ncbi:MAG TPA: glycosyltransferase family 4 protein [Acidimicrobiia bacterium]|nr:glycosyltransferase family 4 protein [Acidimicrobiia bacterium]
MRIALVCPYSVSIPGGVQGQVLGLAHSLRAQGYDARVLAPADGPPPAPFVTSVGPSTKVSSNGSISPIAPGKDAARRTLEALRGFRPDVLHLHEPLVPGPPSAALLGTRIPSVGTFHMAAPRSDTFYRWFGKPASGVAKLITIRTAVSTDARRTAQENLGGTYWVLPNGVDLEPIEQADPYPTIAPTVLFIGRHEPRKGLGVLLDAWEQLDADAVLWVASDGPETATLQARGVGRVEWIGRITDAEKARRLRAATVFCAPALHGESFGVVLLEAMAASTTVVASDIPGFRNVARPGVEAMLVAPGDPGALADVLRSVLTDPPRRDELAEAGRRRAEEFSMARLARRFIPLYEAAIACTPP